MISARTSAATRPAKTAPAETESYRSIWVRAYRAAYPVSDRWATGPGLISHTEETQDRIFRMTEQLVAQGVVPGRAPVFKALIDADRKLPAAASDAVIVAAGWGAHRAITGSHEPQPVTLLVTGGTPVAPLVSKLRAQGYEPVAFDGRDPAAYCWAIFEMRACLQANAEALDSDPTCRPAVPFGVAITPAHLPADAASRMRTWRS